jgi:hypothetical protein
VFYDAIERVYYGHPRVLFVNMDQTRLRYDMQPLTTVEPTGSCSVQIRGSEASSEHVTAVLGVASNGEKLMPMLIYKGTTYGKIAREFRRRENPYPVRIHYATQPNVWMTEANMHEWLDQVFIPFAAARAEFMVCLLLDSLPIHRLPSV